MKLLYTLTAGLLAAGVAAIPSTAADACLKSKNVEASYPGDADYDELAEPFNLRLQYKPAIIALPKNNKDVQNAVLCASQCNYKVQARSGGHSYASYSSGGKDGSMVINLEYLQDIKLDNTNNVVKVGSGVRLGNLAQGVYDQGKRAISHGTCPGVGIGGHFTHGGYGHTSRNWGIALDHIVAVDIVTADGKLRHASETENKDLYWGVRGAAENLGIVTTFYLRTEAAPEFVTYFQFQWADTLFKNKKAFTDTFLHIQTFSQNASVVDNRISYGIYLDGNVTYNLGGTFFGTPEEFNKTIVPELLRGTAPSTKITVQKYEWIPYLILMSDKTHIVEPKQGYDEHDTFFAKSITVPEPKGLTATTLNNFWDYISKPAPYSYFVIINLYGGPGSAINTKDTSFAAYNDRDSLWVFQNYGINPGTNLDYINGINKVIIENQPETHFGAYLNYVDPTYSADEAHELYYGKDLTRKLEKLKAKYDPTSVFWFPQAFVPKA
ncbi:FAD-binding domain-containing protein [Bimuria novae-zelandiae CBS 107.79]|uniref:FAD-binding domain-containing protein n=1 Tax=Bimuria novae-zelandiae CBS 107.79 TaxID=1447943 RepID=A0A6A5ULY9_9PLEO|nr:FAD-binding domain-containing protein [Bimuria novae-zelandiae CBS 107.79]